MEGQQKAWDLRSSISSQPVPIGSSNHLQHTIHVIEAVLGLLVWVSAVIEKFRGNISQVDYSSITCNGCLLQKSSINSTNRSLEEDSIAVKK